MKKALIAAAAVAATLVAAPAMAQDIKGYASIGYAHNDIEDVDVQLGAVVARVGARTTYFGAELEGQFGIVDDNVGGTEVDLDSAGAVYAVGFFPVGESFELIGRVGIGSTRVDIGGLEDSDKTVNYGVGAQWNWSENNAIRGDYTYVDFDAGIDANVFALSYVRKF